MFVSIDQRIVIECRLVSEHDELHHCKQCPSPFFSIVESVLVRRHRHEFEVDEERYEIVGGF
jgi:hypothetical protein